MPNPNFKFEELLLKAVQREADMDAIASDDEGATENGTEAESESEIDEGPSSLPPPSHQSHTSANRHRACKKSQGHSNHSRKHQKVREGVFSHHEPCPKVQKKYISTAVPILTPTTLTSTSKAATTAYVGLDDEEQLQIAHTLREMLGDGGLPFKLYTWDRRTPTPIFDRDLRLIAVLAGHPDDVDWTAIHREAAAALESARRQCRTHTQESLHRATLHCGVSHGSSQKFPKNLNNSTTNVKIIKHLNGLQAFQRMSGFATSVVANWAPLLFQYYADGLQALHAHDPSLERNFPTSIFAATTYNLGPQTVCFKHTDFANLAFGWCAVTALGSFDPKKGGHLVLWDCELVIEFPPGSTILIPSAILLHSNLAILPGETRYSFTQYTAGGLFRWVERGFKKSVDFFASLEGDELVEERAKEKAHWQFGLSLLPHLNSVNSKN